MQKQPSVCPARSLHDFTESKYLNRAVFGKNCVYCQLQNSWIKFSGQIGQIGDSHLYCFQILLQLLEGASV